MRVLVLGAGEYAGRHALEAFRAAGVEGRNLRSDASTGDPDFRGVDLVVNCRVTFDALLRQPLRFAPDPVLDSLVERMRLAGVARLVHLSSSAVLGAGTVPARGGTRVLETAEPRPAHGYERMKLREEAWLRERSGLEVVVLRAAPGFGAGDRVLAKLLGELRAGKVRLPMGGRAPRSFLAAPDLGRALAAAALRGRPGATYLAAGFDGSWRELMEMAAFLLEMPKAVGSTPYDFAYLAAMARELTTRVGSDCWLSPYLVDLLAKPQLLDDGLTRRDLTWSPQVGSFQEGVADLVRWFLSVPSVTALR